MAPSRPTSSRPSRRKSRRGLPSTRPSRTPSSSSAPAPPSHLLYTYAAPRPCTALVFSRPPPSAASSVHIAPRPSTAARRDMASIALRGRALTAVLGRGPRGPAAPAATFAVLARPAAAAAVRVRGTRGAAQGCRARPRADGSSCQRAAMWPPRCTRAPQAARTAAPTPLRQPALQAAAAGQWTLTPLAVGAAAHRRFGTGRVVRSAPAHVAAMPVPMLAAEGGLTRSASPKHRR